MIPINKPSLTYEEIRAVVRVLRSGILTSKNGAGPNALRFEAVFSKFVGTRYAVAMNSGTAALHAALIAAGVGEGDEVILPSLTFVATAEAVALTGATPIFVEIDPDTYCIDPEEIEAALTSRTKAVIPVHLYGLTGDMDRIMEVAENYHLVVIEDAAQAHGAEYKGRQAGGLGDMACFSFYGSKNMVTGEGGMVTTNSIEYNKTLRHLRNHGETRRYQSTMLGHNYRMPEMEAALGVVQLAKLPKFVESRRRNAVYLMEKLKNVEPLQLPTVPATCVHAWYVFTVRMKGANAARRNKVVNKIRARRVDAQIYYPKPIHRQDYYRRTFRPGKLPTTEKTARQVFSLPVHPSLSERELKRIVRAVKAAVR